MPVADDCAGTYTLVHATRLLGRISASLPDADPSRGGNRLTEGIHFTASNGTITFHGLVGRRVAIAAVAGQDYDLGTGAQVENHRSWLLHRQATGRRDDVCMQNTT